MHSHSIDALAISPPSFRWCRTTPRSPRHYKRRLAGLPGLSHVTIEVERCPGEHSHPAQN